MKRFHLAAILMLAPLQFAAAEPTTEPVWMMVRHDVADMAAWREVFDGGLAIRQDAGELQFEVLTMSTFPNSVIGIFEWTSEEATLAFVNDPLVRGAMNSAGVISEPIITLHENDPRYWITSDEPEAVSGDIASSN
ncbi:hypothetical protein ROLI_033350 [Roseobacter fucihabitans]|uniref:ABM domain-containing protein n=1 Tax=Roseobacter fucihabitans TaxID=1537242 RepID=A0ABZ2BW72_9RHOB|nr:hypothetical protein [Roseobacter litoralis]MBC6966753.1 hypothetical protein [Roseobacter litoralis]